MEVTRMGIVGLMQGRGVGGIALRAALASGRAAVIVHKVVTRDALDFLTRG